MNPPLPHVQDIALGELTSCLQWLLGKMRVERAQWVVAQLTDRVERQRMADIFAVESRRDGQIVAAALALAQPPGAATLLAIGDSEADGEGDWAGDRAAPLPAVLARLRSRLHTAGTHFLQAAAESEEHGHRLHRLGFVHLADLAFMVLDADRFVDRQEPAPADCRLERVGSQPARVAHACELAAGTFAGTQDCPRLNDFRSAAEIIAGYRLSASFDPTLWYLAITGSEPVGCLFLTRHRGVDTSLQGGCVAAAGAIEISYMGLLSKHRGRGLGKVILNEAVRLADQWQAPRMVLAVDRENSPAIALYQRSGWLEAAQESVWGSKVLP